MRLLFISVSIILLGITTSSAQDLDKILEAHYKAASQEKMEKVETLVIAGTNVLNMAGIESTFIAYQARPNKIRAEGEFQGASIIQTYNGETGWMYAPMMGISEPKEMNGEELNTLLNQAEFENDLWNYEAKGSTIEIAGKSEDGTADILKLTNKDGHIQLFSIDMKSHLITSIKTKQVMGGSETEIEILLSDYKVVKGIPVAHKVTSKMNGQVVTSVQIKKVEFNKKIDPALFEKPIIELR